MKPPVSEELIDQLVTGSLRGPEYRKAVLLLEANPQRWRDCALAFLQEQAIAEELNQLAKSNVSWHRDSDCVASASVVATEHQPATRHVNRHRFSWLYKFGSLAAMLLMSFSVGWMGSTVRDRSAQAESESMDLASTSRRSAGSPNLQLKNMTVDHVLPNRENDNNNYSFVGNNWIPIDEQIPPDLAKLEREGRIKIEKKTAVMPVDYGDMTVLVPVQQLRVVPVTFSY